MAFKKTRDYYIEKYNMFNNVVPISATYLDTELKSFDFVQDFTDKTAVDFQSIAHKFIKSKNKEPKYKVKVNYQ